MKNYKRWLALLMASCMLMTMLPETAYADVNTDSETEAVQETEVEKETESVQETETEQTAEAVISNFEIKPSEDRTDVYLLSDLNFLLNGLVISFEDASGTHEFTYNSNEYWEYACRYESFLSFDKPEISETGEYTLTLNWLGETVDYKIQVVDKLVADMRVTAYPTRQEYYVGADQRVRLSGLELEVTEMDGTVNKYQYGYNPDAGNDSVYTGWDSMEESDYYAVDSSNIDWNTPGNYTYTLTYKGVAVEIPMTVSPCPIASIEVTKAPNQNSYYRYELQDYEPSLVGMQFKINYIDGTASYTGTIAWSMEDDDDARVGKNVSYHGNFYWFGFDRWKLLESDDVPAVGSNMAVISYMGVTTEVPIEVKQDPVKSITCTKNPEKMSYLKQETAVDLYGAEFEIAYSDGKTKKVAITEHTDEKEIADDFDAKLSGYKVMSYQSEEAESTYYSYYLNIHYLNQHCIINLDNPDFSKETDVTDMENGGIYPVSVNADQKYWTFSFVPKTSGEYYFYSSKNSSDSLYTQNGNVIEYDDYDKSSIRWESYSLSAGATYYYVVGMSDFGTAGSSFCYLTSEESGFKLTADMVTGIQLTADAGKTTWYDFEQKISTENSIDLAGTAYLISYECSGVAFSISGKLTDSDWSEYDQSTRLYGQTLSASWKETTYDEDLLEDIVAETDTNAIQVTYAGKIVELPVVFHQPSPVETITVSKNPWAGKSICQYEAEDILGNRNGLELTVRYSDGRSDEVITWTGSNHYTTSTGRFVTFKIKNMDDNGRPVVGENALVISYMGKTIELPLFIQQNPVSSITVVKNPDQMTYFSDIPRVDLYGMQLQLTYMDGTSKLVEVTAHGSSYKVADEYDAVITGVVYTNLSDEVSLQICYMDTKMKIQMKVFDITNAVSTDIQPDQNISVSLGDASAYQVFRFVPEETAVYKWYSSGSYDTYAYLYNSEGTLLVKNDDDDDGLNFGISRTLYQGNTYYFIVRMLNVDEEGSFTCTLHKDSETQPVEKTTINALNLNITKPATDSNLQDKYDISKQNEMDGFSISSCTWSPEKSKAQGGEAYRLILVLEPDEDYMFATGLVPTINESAVTTKMLGSSGNMTIVYTFPYTECKLTIPELDSYTLDTSMNAEGLDEDQTVLVDYNGSYSFRYTKSAEGDSMEKFVVKIGANVLTPDADGIYTVSNITSNLTVLVKVQEEITVGFSGYDYDTKEFTLIDGEEPFTLTPMATVNGETEADGVWSWSATQGYDEYFDIVQNTDGTITVNPKKATNQTYTLTISYRGQSASIDLSIVACSLDQVNEDEIARFKVNVNSPLVYTGTALKPQVTVTDIKNGTVLVENTDYKIICYNNTDAGTGNVKIDGVGRYAGNLEGIFTIQKAERVIKASDQTMGIGSGKIVATTNDNAALSYTTTADKSDIEVNPLTGAITAYRAGTYSVTITGTESANYKAASKTITLIVEPSAGKVSSLANSYTKTYGDKAFSLGANGSGALIYSSSNDRVAVVSVNGTVTIKGAGTAVITICSVAENNYKSASKQVAITVNRASKAISVRNASISKTYGSKAFTLGVSVTGNEKATYSSSNKKVATVSPSGKVIVTGCGLVKITIKSTADTNYNAAKSKMVMLTVSPKKAVLSSVSSKKKEQISVKWKKDSSASGYRILYSTSKSFKKSASVSINSNKTVSKSINTLLKGKKYYIKICAYKSVDGKKIYGEYSSMKDVTVKKK